MNCPAPAVKIRSLSGTGGQCRPGAYAVRMSRPRRRTSPPSEGGAGALSHLQGGTPREPQGASTLQPQAPTPLQLTQHSSNKTMERMSCRYEASSVRTGAVLAARPHRRPRSPP